MWIVFALLAAMVSATVVTLSKAGVRNVSPSLAFAVQAVLIILISWGAVLWEGLLPEITKIDRKSWGFLLTAGVLTAASSLLTFRALSLGDASRVSPLTNISLVFAITLAAVFLKEKITWQVLLGAALMAAGAILIATTKPTPKKETAANKNGRSASGTAIYKSGINE